MILEKPDGKPEAGGATPWWLGMVHHCDGLEASPIVEYVDGDGVIFCEPIDSSGIYGKVALSASRISLLNRRPWSLRGNCIRNIRICERRVRYSGEISYRARPAIPVGLS